MGWIIASSILAFLVAVVLIFSFVTYRIVFYSPKNRKEDFYDIPADVDFAVAKDVMIKLIDEMILIPCEEVQITSFDGLKLFGRYYHVRDGAPLQIQFHGYRGTSIRDFCGGNKLARESGFNTLVVDQRASGRSEGQTISFGINERKDCLAWTNYAVERFGEGVEIYLSGVSMGGTTVLMAASLDLPKNVKGIIADCPFSSPEGIIKKTCKQRGFSPKIFFPIIALGARLFGRFKLRETTVEEGVKHTRVPILLIHGDADSIVPCEMSKAVYESNKEKITLEIFPNAGHAMSYIVDPARYEKVVKEFLEKN